MQIFIIRLNNDGSLIWLNRFGGNNDESAYAIHLRNDGGYMFGGYASSNDGLVLGNEAFNRYEYWILNTDSTGLPLSQKCFGGTLDDKAYALQMTSDSGFVLAGSARSINGEVTGNHGGDDFWIVKLQYAINMCPPFGNKILNGGIPDASYRWQVNTGSGFTYISDNGYYTGSTTQQLNLVNIPSSWYGSQYRYVINRPSGNLSYGAPFILKFSNGWTGVVSSEWENTGNWGCNVLPDENTDVIIYSSVPHFPVLNSNATIRSLFLSKGTSCDINSGYQLIINH
ncbi:MAG: hypothetical protein IPP72_04270 [Chitinophagaceae bacterium]|nr:hypothetical protein [Chitinophagaceae bacterium]